MEMKNVIGIIVYLVHILKIIEGKNLTPLRNFISKEDHEKLKKYVDEVVNSSFHQLSMPGILSPSTTPEKFLEEERNSITDYQVMLGIVIENYSKYLLGDPRTSDRKDCVKNREIIALQPVRSGSYEIFAIDNDRGTWERSICGSISWQINYEGGEQPIVDSTGKFGKRLLMTYEVPYRGGCDKKKGRHNSFSISIIEVSVNESYHWRNPVEGDKFYERYHKADPTDKKSWLHSNIGYTTVLGLYDEERFAVRAHMDRGCEPILKVQFLPGPKDKSRLLFNVNQQPAALKQPKELIDKSSLGPKNDDGSIPNDPHGGQLIKYLEIGGGIVGGILIIVMIMAICIVVSVRKKRNRTQFFRRPYHQ